MTDPLRCKVLVLEPAGSGRQSDLCGRPVRCIECLRCREHCCCEEGPKWPK